MDQSLYGRVVHLELHTGGPTAARDFYTGLCGWRAQQVRMPAGSYLALELGAEIGGGIVESPLSRPVWLPYVQVAQIAEATDRARLLGARVIIEPREGPLGWRSVVATPTAGEIAFWQPKR
jgi:predicted enzyme related to lactoylglutathione lyase